MTTISVIIATRNRPRLFNDALQSVLRQSAPAAEVIVIDDGSEEAHREGYDLALAAATDRVRYYRLVHRPKGHGQSYALNFGVGLAKSDYVAFLDDDDGWTDAAHLERAMAAIDSAAHPVDLYMANQAA